MLQFTWSKSSLADDLVTLLTTLEVICNNNLYCGTQKKCEIQHHWSSVVDQSSLIKQLSEKQKTKSIKRDTSVDSSQYKRPTGTWSSVVRKMAYLPVRIADPGNSAADTMFWYSFRILPDRLKLIRLYPCGSLRPGISFIFRAWAGRFAATPQGDVVRICAHDFGVMAMLFSATENAFFHAFITLRS